MEGREQRDPGYDDWFDEPEPPTQEAGRPGRSIYDESVEDVWVLPEDRPPRRRSSGGREIVIGGRALSATQVAIVGVSAIVILLAVLAALGVFNGSPTATPATTANPPPTHAGSTSTATNTTPAVQAPTQALQPGDTGSQVKLLQKALAALGYSPGKADGDYGPSTQAAVKQFQTAKGLTVDGVAGAHTIATLQRALSG